MKKTVIASLALGLLGSLSAAQAAPVVVDAGSYYLSFDDSFMPGISFTVANGGVTFSGLGLETSVDGVELTANGDGMAYGYDDLPVLSLFAKEGYVISGVSESVTGSYSGSAASTEEGGSVLLAGVNSVWVSLLDGADLGENLAVAVPVGLQAGQGPVSGDYSTSHGLAFAPVSAVLMSKMDISVQAWSLGGAKASGSLNTYTLNAQTSLVPEPAGLALVLAGLGVVGFTWARRR